ncbi:metal-dependent hydrolase [Candidatus Woesearchaeota archaeon]|nr:metal-dependent hydrolase [Candidatus Woesearchaeota archaeon]
MLGKYHVLIALLLTSPFLVYIIKNYNVLQLFTILSILIFLIGLVIGSLLPDAVDAGDTYLNHIRLFKSKGIIRRTIYFLSFIFPIASKITRWTLKPLTWILKFIIPPLKDGHRGLWHSLLGIIIISIGWFYLSFIISKFINFQLYYLAIGIFIGCFIHLLEDSFTVSGINWLYPLNLHIRGKIKTISKQDPNYRSLKFLERNPTIFIYFLITTIIILVQYTTTLNTTILSSLAQLGIAGIIFRIKLRLTTF